VLGSPIRICSNLLPSLSPYLHRSSQCLLRRACHRVRLVQDHHLVPTERQDHLGGREGGREGGWVVREGGGREGRREVKESAHVPSFVRTS